VSSLKNLTGDTGHFPTWAISTIGFVNDNKDGAGLEYSFNKFLAGKMAKRFIRKWLAANGDRYTMAPR
jgi:hypothetical protein